MQVQGPLKAIAKSKDLIREPLPRRWVDLILYLDEQERKHSQAQTRPLTPAELVSHQIEVTRAKRKRAA